MKQNSECERRGDSNQNESVWRLAIPYASKAVNPKSVDDILVSLSKTTSSIAVILVIIRLAACSGNVILRSKDRAIVHSAHTTCMEIRMVETWEFREFTEY